MKDKEIIELWHLLESHCKSKNYTKSEVLCFLSTCFVGTMEMHGYSQDFMDRTCDRMKENFRKKRKYYPGQRKDINEQENN